MMIVMMIMMMMMMMMMMIIIIMKNLIHERHRYIRHVNGDRQNVRKIK